MLKSRLLAHMIRWREPKFSDFICLTNNITMQQLTTVERAVSRARYYWMMQQLKKQGGTPSTSAVCRVSSVRLHGNQISITRPPAHERTHTHTHTHTERRCGDSQLYLHRSLFDQNFEYHRPHRNVNIIFAYLWALHKIVIREICGTYTCNSGSIPIVRQLP